MKPSIIKTNISLSFINAGGPFLLHRLKRTSLRFKNCFRAIRRWFMFMSFLDSSLLIALLYLHAWVKLWNYNLNILSILSSILLAQLAIIFVEVGLDFLKQISEWFQSKLLEVTQQFSCRSRVNSKYSSDGSIKRTLLLGLVNLLFINPRCILKLNARF